MLISSAQIQAQKPERLMTRLCRHWGHKFPVKLDERYGEIELPMGVCRMSCLDHTLKVELEGDAAQMPGFQQVVADHLQRMAGEEELVIEWL